MKASLVALVAFAFTFALGPVGAALAAEPAPTIATPAQGSSTLEPTPVFSGTSNGSSNPVTVAIYAGSSATGTPIQEPSTAVGPLELEWSVQPSPLAEGTYTAVAEQVGVLGGETTMSAPVSFTIDAVPTITTPPQATTVVEGQNATFTASASGTPVPKVQWQYSDDGGTEWAPISGSGSPTLTFKTVTGENGIEYRAVFTNSVGSTPSAPATLTLYTPPSVTRQPSNAPHVNAGATASFKAAASGAPAPTPQWQVSTDGGVTWANDTTDAGNGTETLSVVTTAAENGNQYRALFTNLAGSATSNEATLEVDTAPVITEQPRTTGVSAGPSQSAMFTAAASATPVPTAQWMVSTDFGKTWSNAKGNVSSSTSGSTRTTSLTITSPTTGENGYEYRAAFVNSVSKTPTESEAATLIVSDQLRTPVVVVSPTNVHLSAGQTATFTAAAEGLPAPQVQWQVLTNGAPEWTNIAGATTDVLTFPTTTAENGYQYRAVFSNNINGKEETAITTLATLTVESPPSPSPSPPPSPSPAVSPPAGLTGAVATPLLGPAHLLMQPFPVVRIAGSDTSFGVKLSLLTTQAPIGARVTLTCRGAGCPLKREIRVAVASTHSKAGAVVLVFKRFERALRAGIVLQIRIWKPGQIGKYTSFTVRRGKLPVRVDTCLDPTGANPIACPTS